jgi:hypothetical protein
MRWARRFLVCLGLAITAPAGADEQPAGADQQPTGAAAPTRRVAVFELRAPGMAAGARDGLMAVLTEAVAKAEWLDVVSKDEIAAMLDAEAQKQLLGCDDTECLAEIAGALDVELMIAGAVTPLGEGSVITLQLVNQRFANVMNRVSLTWPGEARHLPDAIEAAAQLLVLDPASRPPATLLVGELPDQAELFLDEVGRGAAASDGTARLEGVAVGVHMLRLTAPGHVARELPVVARAGAEVNINGALESTPFYATWWFWTGVATLAAVTVGAAALIYFLDDRGAVLISARPAELEPAQ